MNETIAVCKHGVVIKEFPGEYYQLSVLNGIVSILNKDSRKVAFVLSANFYDFIEIVSYQQGAEE